MAAANDFAERYMITSPRTSRIYTRTMLLGVATRRGLAKMLKIKRAAIGAVLDDDTFMRPRTGMVPGVVAEDAVYEAFRRSSVAA